MRASSAILLLALGCGDPYRAAYREQIRAAECGEPLGHPTDTTVSGMTICRAIAGRPAGFVMRQGTGTHSVYGDTGDAYAANVLLESAPGCVGVGGNDRSASRGFWSQIDSELRRRFILSSGPIIPSGCDQVLLQPHVLAIKLLDWRDVDATVAIIDAALEHWDVCSTVGVAVEGPGCPTAL